MLKMVTAWLLTACLSLNLIKDSHVNRLREEAGKVEFITDLEVYQIQYENGRGGRIA